MKYALHHADRVVAYSIGIKDGDAWPPPAPARPISLRLRMKPCEFSLQPKNRTYEEFDGYPILGQMELDRDQALQAVTELESAISRSSGERSALTAISRGLRVVSGGRIYDVLIGSAFRSVEFYREDTDAGTVRLASLGSIGKPDALDSIFAPSGVAFARDRR